MIENAKWDLPISIRLVKPSIGLLIDEFFELVKVTGIDRQPLRALVFRRLKAKDLNLTCILHL